MTTTHSQETNSATGIGAVTRVVGGELHQELTALAATEAKQHAKVLSLVHAVTFAPETAPSIAADLVPDFAGLGFENHELHGGLETSILDYFMFELADHLADSWCAGAPALEIYAVHGLFVDLLGDTLGSALAKDVLAITALQADAVGIPSDDVARIHSLIGGAPEGYQPRTPLLWSELAASAGTSMADIAVGLASGLAWSKDTVPSAL